MAFMLWHQNFCHFMPEERVPAGLKWQLILSIYRIQNSCKLANVCNL